MAQQYENAHQSPVGDAVLSGRTRHETDSGVNARVLRREMLRMMKPGDVLNTLDEVLLWEE
jgi:hypothetical protein